MWQFMLVDSMSSAINEKNYLDKIKNNQNNLDNLDTISGCTYSTKYLKEMVTKTIEDYNK